MQQENIENRIPPAILSLFFPQVNSLANFFAAG